MPAFLRGVKQKIMRQKKSSVSMYLFLPYATLRRGKRLTWDCTLYLNSNIIYSFLLSHDKKRQKRTNDNFIHELDMTANDGASKDNYVYLIGWYV